MPDSTKENNDRPQLTISSKRQTLIDGDEPEVDKLAVIGNEWYECWLDRRWSRPDDGIAVKIDKNKEKIITKRSNNKKEIPKQTNNLNKIK